MIRFRKARAPRQVLNDLDAYISGLDTEPIEWLAREVKSWGEFSYAEIEQLILNGQLNDLIDWQSRYADVINQKLASQWTAAITAASAKATKGKVVLDDSDEYVKAWLKTHGAELVTRLSEESKAALAMIILHGQAQRLNPFEIAKQIRPIIGLNQRQAAANVAYREKVYRQLTENGMSAIKAAERAEKAAVRYASKQHRFRAETIVNTELAFAYNRGAHMGVGQAIANGLMGRCEMVWSTAGTNRVCSRCLALKDTVVGHTDESGVTIPPLHPRCRCAIMYREIAEPKLRGLAAGNIDTTIKEGSPPKLIGKLEKVTPQIIQKTFEYYEAQIVNAPIENGIIITATGEIYHCTGDLNTLDTIVELDEKLYGAYVTHNHPIGSANEYTFSDDDKRLFANFKPACLRGIDEKFIYELNRNTADNEFVGYELHELYSLELNFEDPHVIVMLWALTKGFGYWRKLR